MVGEVVVVVVVVGGARGWERWELGVRRGGVARGHWRVRWGWDLAMGVGAWNKAD